MKKISSKLFVSVLALLGIGTAVFTNATTLTVGAGQRDNMNVLSQTFWDLGPSSGNIVQALFGTNTDAKTAYTQNRSGYVTGDCNLANMHVNYVNTSNFNDTIDVNSNNIFVLSSGAYWMVNGAGIVSGSCIALIGTWDVTIDWWLVSANNQQYIIIDNIDWSQAGQFAITTAWYTNTGNNAIRIDSSIPYTGYYNIQGDTTTMLTGLMRSYITWNIDLTNGDGTKNIDVTIGTWKIFIWHIKKSIILDTTAPTFTGTSLKGDTVTSGGFYNTGISFTFTDANLSDATLDDNNYTSGEAITTAGIHTLIVNDLAGNSTGITFTIEYTDPIFTGKTFNNTPVVSGGFYNTGISFTFTDANLSGATLDGNIYASGEQITDEATHVLVVSDLAGNSTGSTFTIDYTAPTFTALTSNGTTVVSGGAYSTGVTIDFNSGELASSSLNGSHYTGGQLISTAGNYTLVLTDKAGNKGAITFAIDYTAPTFTGKTLTNTTIVSGGFYNTGISFTFTDPNILGATLDSNTYISGSTINATTSEGIHTFTVTDKAGNSTGMTFTIDITNPTCTSISPATGSVVSGDYLDLKWTCNDNLAGLSGQTLSINNAIWVPIYTTGLNKTATGFVYYGASNTYNWKIVIFTRSILPTVQIPGNSYLNKYYVSGANISFAITGNMAFIYEFSGDITPVTSNYSNGTKTQAIVLSWSEGNKNIAINYFTGGITGALPTMAFYLDTTAPVITGTFPTPALITNQTSINFQRTATDTGAGISGYTLKLDNIVIYTGSATNYTLTGISTGVDHTWTVSTLDHAWNSKITSANVFTIDTSAPIIHNVTDNAFYNTGISPTFTMGTGKLNGLTYISGTPITGNGNYTLVVTNVAGNATTVRFTIDNTKPVITLTSPTSGAVITNSNAITFLRNGSDTNLSGYEFNLYGAYSTGFFTTSNTITLPNVPNNNYTWDVKAIDKAGNETISSWASFTVNLLLSGSVSITGTNSNTSGQTYTNTTFGITVSANKDASITIIGNLSWTTVSDSISGGISKVITVSPTATEGIKSFTVTVSNGIDPSFTTTVTGYVDVTAPSVPSFVGQATTYSGAFNLAWANAIDAGVGVADYTYAILNGTTIVKSGISTTTGLSVANLEIGSTGNFTIYVAARDRFGYTSTSGSLVFGYTALEDTSPDSFSIAKEYDVDLDTEIESETITVAGLSAGTKVIASVSDWNLIINGNYMDNSTGYVQNGDKVQIAIYSSTDYNDITSGILKIGDKSSTFKITTLKDDNSTNSSSSSNWYTITTLSTTQKLHISIIYNTLSELYNGSKLEDFMVSLKSIVKDKIDTMVSDKEDKENIETMKYLYNLINKDFDTGNDISGGSTSTSSYTAPNGKDYSLKYVSGAGYTSSNFIVSGRYFSTLAEIKSYIDRNNPKSVYVGWDYAIDQSRSSSTYTAPNGKTYTFFKTTTGKYGSNNFASAKLFDNIETMKKHIAVNNPK